MGIYATSLLTEGISTAVSAGVTDIIDTAKAVLPLMIPLTVALIGVRYVPRLIKSMAK